jgi:hypothetical protein
MPESDAPQAPDAPEDPPPFLKSWRNVYLLLVGELCLTVLVFYLLVRWAS